MVDTVVLLTVDALSARRVGALGHDRETTPGLDARRDRAAWYTACIAQSSHTRESMPSLFHSAYPRSLGDVGPVPDDRPTLATALSDAGFASAGFHSNPYLSRAYGFDRGFDTFDDALPLGSNRLGVVLHRAANHIRTRPYTRAEALNERGLEWLDRTDGRRFLWLHYMDPHGPYQPPARHQRAVGDPDEVVGPRRAKRLWRRTVDEPETITESERRTLLDLHDAEIRYTDEQVTAMLEALEGRDLGETLVVVGADHGELFGEHGRYGHPRHLHEELIHVPLWLFGDPVTPGRRDGVVENVDIAPTVLDAAGVGPESTFAGESLLGGGGERSGDGESDDSDDALGFAHARGEGEASDTRRFAARGRRFKYCLERGEGTSTGALYDLDDEGEGTDVSAEHPDVAEELRGRLEAHVERTAAGTDDATAEDGAVDGAVEERLRDLGYR